MTAANNNNNNNKMRMHELESLPDHHLVHV